MLVSSDFLSYLKRKNENTKTSSPLVTAALKASPGGKEKAPPVEQLLEKQKRTKEEVVDYLNDKPSTLNVVL
ncbi:MAG: hypothetical protein LBD41_02695 [Clostridiales Family XIII bacterium]|jgi:hypothetical protein|nr:hypothetical protein [Clostridiales Family XIII bacterium]